MDAREVYLVQPAPEDIERHLERPITATIGTLNVDGSIHLAFVLFLWEDGKLYFETASMTKKARNVASRDTASFAIEGKGFMAMAEGRARVIRGDEAHALNGRLRRKYLTEPAAETVGKAWGTVDDISIEITPTKWRSWSNSALSELGEQAAGELPRHEWWVAEGN
jgi:nitroimidazol reductase NimA-like FMN-containing flavoprotein (pyridoxamine 5'-phosphate oxidase superfamily)